MNHMNLIALNKQCNMLYIWKTKTLR